MAALIYFIGRMAVLAFLIASLKDFLTPRSLLLKPILNLVLVFVVDVTTSVT